MPKYYCDYCDIFLTHDSSSVRKAHNAGRNHLVNVKTYYSELGHETTQSVMDTINRAYAEAGTVVPPQYSGFPQFGGGGGGGGGGGYPYNRPPSYPSMPMGIPPPMRSDHTFPPPHHNGGPNGMAPPRPPMPPHPSMFMRPPPGVPPGQFPPPPGFPGAAAGGLPFPPPGAPFPPPPGQGFPPGPPGGQFRPPFPSIPPPLDGSPSFSAGGPPPPASGPGPIMNNDRKRRLEEGRD